MGFTPPLTKAVYVTKDGEKDKKNKAYSSLEWSFSVGCSKNRDLRDIVKHNKDGKKCELELR